MSPFSRGWFECRGRSCALVLLPLIVVSRASHAEKQITEGIKRKGQPLISGPAERKL